MNRETLGHGVFFISVPQCLSVFSIKPNNAIVELDIVDVELNIATVGLDIAGVGLDNGIVGLDIATVGLDIATVGLDIAAVKPDIGIVGLNIGSVGLAAAGFVHHRQPFLSPINILFGVDGSVSDYFDGVTFDFY